jgi:epoxyqueuosine reductase
MGWRGAAVLRRNAAVALGNALDRSTVGPLAESLCRDPHPMVRGHAAWALGRIGSPAAVAALRGQSDVEPSEEVRAEISMALQPFKPSPSGMLD